MSIINILYIYIYIYMGGTGTKFDCMKMYKYEKTQGFR